VNYRSLSLLSGLLLGCLCAVADPVDVTFAGGNGATDFGYSVGPSYATINGDPVTLFSVDFNNSVSLGESWQANLTPLDGNDLSQTRYGGAVGLPNALTLYEEAAWLAGQYASNSGDYGDIQATIWQLFDPWAIPPSSQHWALLASSNYQNVNLAQWEVVTNVGPVQAKGQVQEFLLDPPAPAPVPEPSAVLLLATAFGITFLILRRRLAA
jgi:hypothetical protein